MTEVNFRHIVLISGEQYNIFRYLKNERGIFCEINQVYVIILTYELLYYKSSSIFNFMNWLIVKFLSKNCKIDNAD